MQLTATDQRLRTSLVRTLQGKLPKLPVAVCVLLRQRHQRDKHPKYFLWTELALSAQQIRPLSQKRWPMEGDNCYVKHHLGLADLRVQSYEATEKWFAMVCVTLAFFQWRFHHAPAEEHVRSVADVVRHHRYKHARILLAMACQEAAQLADYRPVLQRFLCQPT